MAKLPRDVSGEQAIKVFRRAGYFHDHTRGSHAVLMHKENPMKRLVVPLHKALKVGTLSRLLKDAGLTVEEFIRFL